MTHGEPETEIRRATTAGAAIDPLLDDAPCGFVSFADDGTVRVVNRTLAALLGFDREELIGGHLESILTVGSRIFYQTHLFPLVRLHGRADEIFLLLRGKDGEEVAMLANLVRHERRGEWVTDCVLLRLVERRKFEDALLAAKKSAEAARTVAEAQREELQHANDLLERQAVELELAEATLLEQSADLERQRAIAEDANRAKSAFLATMSHELRTPLNAIGGYVQLLEMGVHGPLSDTQLQTLERVTKSQQHLLRLINDILNLARIEAGRVDFDLKTLSVSEIVQAILPMIEPQLTMRQLRYEVKVAEDLRTHADREKVEQILLNLLSNASKFTGRGGLVTIEADADPADASRVHLRVRDTGVGIPADRLEAIFEPFVQVDVNRDNRAGGTGLGLAISRNLARGMGGDLTAESTLAVGTCFTLTLPRASE
jgi:PAS domain S-box-containing protein